MHEPQEQTLYFQVSKDMKRDNRSELAEKCFIPNELIENLCLFLVSESNHSNLELYVELMKLIRGYLRNPSLLELFLYTITKVRF